MTFITNAKKASTLGQMADSRSAWRFSKERIRYIPCAPTLSPRYLFQTPRNETLPYPLCEKNGRFFYRARVAIFHLIRALRFQAQDTVLVPDYHSGGEVEAIRSAGANIYYYPIRKDLKPDLERLEHACRKLRPRALFTIHYLGWPQPIEDLAYICRKYEMLLIEDCALSPFSKTSHGSLGTYGHYSVFCLYKTLPIPNGGILLQNSASLEELTHLKLRPCGLRPIAGRSTDLFLEWFRSRFNRTGAALTLAKATVGRYLSAIGVESVPIGDVGFEPSHLDVGMSSICHALLKRFDYFQITESRRRNYRYLHDRLSGHVNLLDKKLESGVCPIYFPILAADKASTAKALRKRGISAIEFWNYGAFGASDHENPDARFLRKHLLELPVHQDLDLGQLEYMVKETKRTLSKSAY